ncbi:hypothetical protein KJ937_01900, partial [Patescibacteria group bacterium]|nr:hypothetical protein [Patescibacteria group bacterium]
MYRAQIKALRYFILLALLICGGFVVGGQKTAFATTAINRQLNYQAKLLTANSVPVSDASYSITFSIYDAATGGNRLWTAAGTTGSPSAVSVSVESGLLTVQLGDVSAGQNAFDLNWYQQDLYLGVTIGSDSEMTPRKRLTAVPYAFVAETLQGQYASSSVDSGGTLFSLRQHKADAAAADRAALYISTSGTSNTYDYLIKGSNGSEVFTVSRQGNVTTTGNLATDGNNILGSASSDSLVVNAGVNSNFNPFTNGTYNLGNGLLSWQQIFASSTVHAGGVTSTGHVNPFANDTYDLGALGTAWKDVYASGTAYVQDDVLVGGQSVCLVDGTNCADDRNWKYTLATDLARNATSTTDIVIGGTATTTAPVYFQLDGVSASSNRLIIGQNQNMNLVLGNTTSSGLNSLFQLSGNDLYVEGNIGSASSVYTNGAFVVGTGSTFYGDGYLSKTDGTYTIKSSSDLVLSPSTGQIAFTPTSGYVSSTAHILSATNAAYNLGSATYSWGQMFASSTVHAGGVTSTGNINPFANDAYDLGLFGAAWKDIYASGTAYVQDDVIIGG